MQRLLDYWKVMLTWNSFLYISDLLFCKPMKKTQETENLKEVRFIIIMND